MKKVYLSKEPAPDPIIRLVQGDTDTQIITFRVPQFAGGVDLKDHEWSVLFHGEHGQHDVSFIGKGELHGSLIEFNWTVPSAVCKCPGRTWIMPEGIFRNEDGTGTVWRSESRCIYVAPAVIAKPGEIEHVLQPYQDLIVTLLGECKELKPIVDELEERVEKLDEEVPHDILAELAGKANQAEVDRISESVDTIGGALAQTQDKVEEIDGELAGKADKTELAGKADNSRVDQVAANADFAIGQLGNKANTVHSHQIVDVNGLQGTLNMYTELIGEKAPRNHTHRIANVDGLQNELDTVSQHLTNLGNTVNGKIDKPETAPSVGKILKVKSVNEDGTFVCEWDEDKGATALQNVPKSTSQIIGGHKIQVFYGLGITDDGIAFSYPADVSEINAKSSHYRMISADRVDYAVRAGLLSNSQITDADKPAICSTIGAERAKGDWVLKGTITKDAPSVDVDLTGCTELVIGGNGVTTANTTIAARINSEQVNLVYYALNQNNATFVAKFEDNPLGINCLVARNGSNNYPISNLMALCSINGTHINDITKILIFPSNVANVTECEIKIYAR